MNVADYRRSIRFNLGLKADDTVLPDDVVLWALNGAASSIATDKDWPWLYTTQDSSTVSGTPTLPLPEGYTRTVYLKVDGRVLEPTTRISMADADTDTDNGRPGSYSVEANDLRVYPNPDGVYDVSHGFYRSEPELILDTDAPLLPDAYAEWLALEASIKAAIRTNNLSRLQTLREQAAAERKKVIDNYIRANKPGRIRRTRQSIWPSHA